jgi:nicotinic acid phosphoribosyltransferase
MKRAKAQIKATIEQYVRMFPKEYEAFLLSTRRKQDNPFNEYAELKGGQQMVRHLFDLPETLHYALQRALTDEEYDWLYARNRYHNKQEGIGWFIRTFPMFKITKDF